ncbi:MAG: hypothetical protein K2R93_09565 [Gemmatimonadaceae bacterium]|nr:hypothetical protein [Gemmatimonadaceae bacterium]
MRVNVLLFDGFLMGQYGDRQRCLCDAIMARGIDPMDEATYRVVIEKLDGRTFEEVLRMGWATHELVQQDPTLLELMALDANARYAAWLRDGATMDPQVRELVDVLTKDGQRVILRADSRRRDVVPFLERWAMHDVFAFVRCADDPPIAASIYRSSFCRSWEAIIDRVTRWGVDRANVNVMDGNDDARMVALQLLSGAHVTELGY